MTSRDRLRIDIATARYLEALEAGDDATLSALWEAAAADDNLLNAFREIHAGLIEEETARSTNEVQAAVADAVEKHLPSARIERPATGIATVAEVASELFHFPPGGLPAAAHEINARLRSQAVELPDDLGLPALMAWAEAKFGPAPPEYWKAFRQAAIKVRMRANADVEFQLAARRAKPRPEASP